MNMWLRTCNLKYNKKISQKVSNIKKMVNMDNQTFI